MNKKKETINNVGLTDNELTHLWDYGIEEGFKIKCKLCRDIIDKISETYKGDQYHYD